MTDQPDGSKRSIVQQFVKVLSTGEISRVAFSRDVSKYGNNAGEVLSELSDFLFANDSHVLVIDLSQVNHLPSTMLGVLANLAKGNVDVHITHGSDPIVEVIEVLHLDQLLTVHKDAGPPELQGLDDNAPAEEVKATTVAGYFVDCTDCGFTQKVDKHDLGKGHKCESCRATFHVESGQMSLAKWLYADCPECRTELKLARDLLNMPIECAFCGKQIEVRKIV